MTDPEPTDAGVAAEAASVTEPTADAAPVVEPPVVEPPVVEPPVPESPAEAAAAPAAGPGAPLTGAAYDAVIAALGGKGPMPENVWIDWSQPNPIRSAT